MVLRFVHWHLNSALICSLSSAQLISESSLSLVVGPLALASSVVELRHNNTKSCGDGSGAEHSARVRAEKVQVIWMEELQSVPELLPPISSAL